MSSGAESDSEDTKKKQETTETKDTTETTETNNTKEDTEDTPSRSPSPSPSSSSDSSGYNELELGSCQCPQNDTSHPDFDPDKPPCEHEIMPEWYDEWFHNMELPKGYFKDESYMTEQGRYIINGYGRPVKYWTGGH
jgi:hypothetical protein